MNPTTPTAGAAGVKTLQRAARSLITAEVRAVDLPGTDADQCDFAVCAALLTSQALRLLRPRTVVPIHWGTLAPIWWRHRPPEERWAPPATFEREAAALAAVFGAGLVAGLVPALRAYRFSVSDGMMIRT